MKRLILATLFICLFISCENNDDDDEETFSTTCGTDNPLEDLIWLRNIKTAFEQSASAVKREIYQYNYEENTVFLVDGCVDCFVPEQVVYDCEGNIICKNNISTMNCTDFNSNATNKILLWEN